MNPLPTPHNWAPLLKTVAQCEIDVHRNMVSQVSEPVQLHYYVALEQKALHLASPEYVHHYLLTVELANWWRYEYVWLQHALGLSNTVLRGDRISFADGPSKALAEQIFKKHITIVMEQALNVAGSTRSETFVWSPKNVRELIAKTFRDHCLPLMGRDYTTVIEQAGFTRTSSLQLAEGILKRSWWGNRTFAMAQFTRVSALKLAEALLRTSSTHPKAVTSGPTAWAERHVGMTQYNYLIASTVPDGLHGNHQMLISRKEMDCVYFAFSGWYAHDRFNILWQHHLLRYAPVRGVVVKMFNSIELDYVRVRAHIVFDYSKLETSEFWVEDYRGKTAEDTRPARFWVQCGDIVILRDLFPKWHKMDNGDDSGGTQIELALVGMG